VAGAAGSSGTSSGSGGSSQAAPSTGAAPAAAVPGAPPSSNPYGRLREIYARQGDTLQVGLDGVGFLFLGLPDAQSDGMSFKSKENRDNRTLFSFQALKLGTYDLDFLQQDNMAGKTSRETVRVHVVSDQDFNSAVAAPASSPDAATGDPGDTGDPLFAQKLATLGSYQAAVAELLKGYREGNPGLNDQIASLYMRMGSYDAAEKYYARNLTPATDYTPRAVIGLVRVAVVQDDQQALLSYLKRFLAVSDSAAEEPLIQAVRMEKNRAEIGMALSLAGEYVKRYPSGTWRDEADYLTAQLLESDSQFRDIARAQQLYRDIVTGHPESPYADPARQRVLYIDRHFFQVR
jgi:tetratricopeptide (TPR) repeat protein